MKKSFSSILFLLFLLCVQVSHAQSDDKPVADTLQEFTVSDTVKVDTTPAEDPDEDTDAVKVDVDEKDNIKFITKSSPGGGLDSLRLRQVSDSEKASLAGDDDFWYANKIFKEDKKSNNSDGDYEASTPNKGLEALLWILIIGGFVTFLVIYLSNSNVGLFRKSRNISATDEDGDLETDDIFAINYQKEIDKAVAASNYRLAVRLLFLQTLRTLSDKNLIRYAHDKTNFEYLSQVSQASWYRQFFRITRNYEYAWYGLFDVDADKFEVIKNDTKDFERQL